MLWGANSGGLEIRRMGGGETRLSGRFPYGAATILWDGGGSGQARKEVIAPRAFASRIASGQDIHFLAGHDFNKPLASRKAGSLTLTDAQDALTFEAVIAPEMRAVSYVADFLNGLTANLITGLSPGFRVANTAMAEAVASDGPDILRTIKAADLFEISAVTVPAYPEAQIEARNWTPGPDHLDAGLSRVLNRWRA